MKTETDTFVFDKFTTIDFLIDGTDKRILINDISWKEYEIYLRNFAEHPSWRLAYNDGRLEIMPTTFEQQSLSVSFCNLVRAYSEFFNLDLEGRGSTTFRSKILKKGVEPDECFYIQSAENIIGKTFKKSEFPMPDIAVEIDITTESLDKFPIYAALEVPELWVYDGKHLAFYELDSGNYHQIPHSRALPQLSAKELERFLEISKKQGQTAALKSFRQSLQS